MKAVVVSLMLILLAVPAFSQSTPGAGSFGIGTSIAGAVANNIATVANGLHASYYVTNSIDLTGGFGLATIKDVGTVFSFDVAGFYRFNRNQLAPFVGGGIFISVNSPSAQGAKSTTQFGILAGGGAEYYFSKNFGINLLEGIQFNTEPTTFGFISRIGLNWYFN